MKIRLPQVVALVICCLDLGLVMGGYQGYKMSTPEHQDNIEILSDFFTLALVFWAGWDRSQ